MLDFSKYVIPAKKDMVYWFLRKGSTTEFAVINTITDKHVADYISDEEINLLDGAIENDDTAEDVTKDIKADFVKFTKRPEFIIGTKIPDKLLTDTPIDKAVRNELKSYCEQFITGCCYMMYDDEIGKKYSDRAIKWLASTDFYDAPASTKYHDSEPSGLLRHTMKVVNRIIDLMTIDPFRSINTY